MNLYDRYSGKVINSEKSMPKDIDLGRYCLENGEDITNSNFDAGIERFIHQDLLKEEYLSTHELLKDIGKKVNLRGTNEFDLYPLVQSIEDKLEMNDFERYLCENISHLEEICRLPHFLLQRSIEKVPVSRAKRIPSKSYQYLASHTEDWQQKSIVAFRPSRVLNEELDLNFDIYENQITLALVERCLRYLNARLKEVLDISKFMEEYSKLLDKRNDDNSWYEKVQRNLTLIGGVYSDENYSGEQNSNRRKIATTEEKLRGIHKRLLQIRSSDLFDEVNYRATKGIVLRNTNVLVNHKHYKYVRNIWIELNKLHPEKTEEDCRIEEQDIIGGLRSYAKILIAYTVEKCLDYELDGTYSSWEAIHEKHSGIVLNENSDNTISLKIGNREVRFVVICNRPCADMEKLPHGTYLLCYSQSAIDGGDKAIRIDPMDCDSAERLGTLLRKYLILDYVERIKSEFKFPQTLRDFVGYINASWIKFDTRPGHYTYSFLSPAQYIDKARLSSQLVVGRDIRDDQKKELLSFIDEITSAYRRFYNENMYCFHCLMPYNEHTVTSFEYLECDKYECGGFVLDISQDDRIILKNIDEKFEGRSIDWGYDCLDFRISSL